MGIVLYKTDRLAPITDAALILHYINTLVDQRNHNWPKPPAAWALGRDEVHVWQFSLRTEADQLASLLATLDQDERTKAERRHDPISRMHHIAAHGVLRSILGAYLNVSPKELVFRHGPHGKPDLTTPGIGLQFNLSHSHGRALLAVSKDRQVGVDLEYLRPEIKALALARRFFTTSEVDQLAALPEPERTRAFFTVWTCKEALVKAQGKGIIHESKTIEVNIRPDQPTDVLRNAYELGGLRWNLRSLPDIDDYAAAVAVEGSDWTLHCWQWSGER
jgi:4'-phosphopantetheinyl transferase